MAISEVVAGRDWLQTINDNFKQTGLSWTDWTNPTITLMNGFTSVTQDKTSRVGYRYLQTADGRVLLTEISGTITKAGYKGENTVFAKIGGIIIPTRPNGYGGVAASNGKPTGYVGFGVGTDSIEKDANGGQIGTINLNVQGYGNGGGNLDGWIQFYIMY